MNHTHAVTEGGPDRCTEADTLLDDVETRLANAHSLNPGAHAWTCEVQHELSLMMVDGEMRMLNCQGDNPCRCHELCYKHFVWGRDRANGTGSRANARNLQVDQRNAFCFALDSFQTSTTLEIPFCCDGQVQRTPPRETFVRMLVAMLFRQLDSSAHGARSLPSRVKPSSNCIQCSVKWITQCSSM